MNKNNITNEELKFIDLIIERSLKKQQYISDLLKEIYKDENLNDEPK